MMLNITPEQFQQMLTAAAFTGGIMSGLMFCAVRVVVRLAADAVWGLRMRKRRKAWIAKDQANG